MNKRTIGILVLLIVVAFYAFGTGFTFFHRMLYALLLLLGIGLSWAWFNLRGIEINLTRTANRGQVGGYLEGQVQIINRTRAPKSWLEVTEVTDLPDHSAGRGVAMVREQRRAWRIETYLSRRGVFESGLIEVVSQDPFGLFRLRRRFLQSQFYIVLPATEPLPDMDPRLATLPSDSRAGRHWEQITTDVASLREYTHGDSFRRIHWPYTARMNNLMVKEFDMGLSAEAWIVLDLHRSSHVGDGSDAVDNTEELAVTIAASLVGRLSELGMPVGLAANGQQNYVLRPDSSPEHPGRLMEALAEVRAHGSTYLERFIYELQPQLSRFNTVTVVTPSPRTEWIPALDSLRRRGVNTSVVLIDPQGFGAPSDLQGPVGALLAYDIATFVVRRGQSINQALSISLNREVYSGTAPGDLAHRETVG